MGYFHQRCAAAALPHVRLRDGCSYEQLLPCQRIVVPSTIRVGRAVLEATWQRHRQFCGKRTWLIILRLEALAIHQDVGGKID
jgi:hypothetical protein